jgi:prepilin-type N-terminal cleavage/methylation domain-containing protein
MTKQDLYVEPRGFTMIELLVVVAICAVLLGLGVPSLRSWIVSQRVISTTGEIVTDMRFARSDALSSNSSVVVLFNNTAGNGCYTVFRSPISNPPAPYCDCALGAGSACTTAPQHTELKTFTLPAGSEVSIVGPNFELYQPGSMLVNEGTGIQILVTGGVGKELKIITTNGLPHPTVCVPSNSTISGYKPCP